MKKGVIFDMDGVIVDNGNFHDEAWSLFCKKYEIEVSNSDIKNYMHGRANKDILTYIFKREITDVELKKYENEKENMYRKIYKENMKPAEGLIDFLKLLKMKKIKIGVATSSPLENIDFIMDNLKIREYFDFIVNSSMVKRGKPFPDIYLKALDKMEIICNEAVVFEDSLSGIDSAYNAGIDVIGVTTANKKEEMKNIVFAVKNFEEDIDKIKSFIF